MSCPGSALGISKETDEFGMNLVAKEAHSLRVREAQAACGRALGRDSGFETGCFEPGVRYHKKRVHERRDHPASWGQVRDASSSRPIILGKVKCIKHMSR